MAITRHVAHDCSLDRGWRTEGTYHSNDQVGVLLYETSRRGLARMLYADEIPTVALGTRRVRAEIKAT